MPACVCKCLISQHRNLAQQGNALRKDLNTDKKEVIADVGSHMEKKKTNLQNFGIRECEDMRAHLSYYTNMISSSSFLKFGIVQIEDFSS